MKIYLFLSFSSFLTFGVFAQEKIEGVMLKNGCVIVIKKGEMYKLENEIGFLNGSKINDDGFIKRKNETPIQMIEGEYRNAMGEKTENMYLIPNDNSVKDTLK